MANLWGLHTDPDVWDDPQKLKPTRFLDQNGKVINREELIPFSTGEMIIEIYAKNSKEGIGSLFDSCVNATGRRPF